MPKSARMKPGSRTSLLDASSANWRRCYGLAQATGVLSHQRSMPPGSMQLTSRRLPSWLLPRQHRGHRTCPTTWRWSQPRSASLRMNGWRRMPRRFIATISTFPRRSSTASPSSDVSACPSRWNMTVLRRAPKTTTWPWLSRRKNSAPRRSAQVVP